MKSIGIIGLIIYFCFIISCATKEEAVIDIMEPELEPTPIVYFGFDFNTSQSAPPFPDYGAAYIINVSDVPIIIPLSTYIDTTMFAYFYYDEEGIRPVFTEMMLPRMNRNNFIVLNPGERVLAYSVAFSEYNRNLYPDALYDAKIVVNNKVVNIRGYIRGEYEGK